MSLELAIEKALSDGSLHAQIPRTLAGAAGAASTNINADTSIQLDTSGTYDVVDEINSGRLSLLKLVESLGSVLTHSDPFQRANGVKLLSGVLARTEKSQMSPQLATVLLQFFLSRLDDQISVEPVLQGLLSMVTCNFLSETEQMTIPTRIFSELNVQSFQQSVRQTVFRLFAALFDTNLPGLQALGSEFVLGFIHVMDGEKDPRILILAFRITQLIIRHIDYTKHVEDLFEVVFCYFPITFRPIPGDPYGVSAEDLKAELCATVSATPLFAPFAIPVLLEKLSSDSVAAKRDVMNAVSECAPVYGGIAFLPHIQDFWKALKSEMVNPIEDANELASLRAIRELVKSLSTSIAASKAHLSPLEELASLILKDCLENLADPELKFAKPCGKIMMSAASASEPACNLIVCKALPVILDLISHEDAPSKRKILVDVLGDFLLSGRLVYSSQEFNNDDLIQSPLRPYCEQLFDLFMSYSLSDSYVPLKISSLSCLTEMFLSKGLLSKKEGVVILELVLSWLLSDPSTRMHSTALKTIQTMSQEKPDLVKEVVLQPLLAALFAAYTDSNVMIAESSLLACLALSKNTSMRPVIVSALVDMFSSTVLSILHDVFLDSKKAFIIIYECRILTILADIISQEAAQSKELALSQPETCKLILSLITTSVTSAASEKDIMSCSTIHLVATVVALITRSLDLIHQSTLLEGLRQLPYSYDDEITPAGVAYVYLSTAVIVNLSAKTPLHIVDLGQFVDKLIEKAMKSDGLYTLAISKLISSLVNKQHDVQGIDVFVAKFTQSNCDSVLSAAGLHIVERRTMLKVYSWISKALVIKADKRGYEMLSHILGLLGDSEIGLVAAEAIKVIISDDQEGTLTKLAGANMRMLYKQRFYSYCIPIVATGFQEASGAQKKAYLYALSHLLHSVPKGVLLSELPMLLPMLLHSLSLSEATLKCGTLDTLRLMVKEAPSVVESQITSIISLLLPMCLFSNVDQGNDVRVRTAALTILGSVMAHLNYTVLHPFKPRVLRELMAALDDPKRIVRKEAANTRSIWFMPQPSQPV
ncbi:hypothetical protein BASA61_007694 [Batrachochytrium salamandrivorans]|nr:hypothetical protein BASA61_007694 [Batrachochytrium salamandrivorans]